MPKRDENKGKLFVCLVVLSFLSSLHVTAETQQQTMVAALPIEKPGPVYPHSLLRVAQEGWALVSYVVQTDGTVGKVVVEDSSGVPAFEGAAIDTVLKWRYKPAMLNNEPIAQCLSVVVNFQIQGIV